MDEEDKPGLVPDSGQRGVAREPVRRGFAAMDPARRKEEARRGGASVPAAKRSFSVDRDLAANAGRKGGATSRGGGRPPKNAPKQ